MVDSRAKGARVEVVSKVCYLYAVTHLTLPIIYIGITYYPTVRWRDHLRDSSNRLLKHYISEYGKYTFKFQVLAEGSREEMEDLEALAILEAKNLQRLYVCNTLVGSVSYGESSQRGISHWNARFSDEDIISIRTRYFAGGITQTELGVEYGCSNKVISKITTGARWANTIGSTCKNSTANRVANRRKLTDTQVEQVRIEAFQEYTDTGKLSIPEIASMYSISRNSMRMLLTGMTYKHIAGPILKKDYYLDFGR